MFNLTKINKNRYNKIMRYSQWQRQLNKRKLSKTQRISIFVATFMATVLLAINCLVVDVKPVVELVSYENVIAEVQSVKSTSGLRGVAQMNDDFLAWITVPDVGISLPIVSTLSTDDEDYYLTHDFKKQSNILGNPYQRHDTKIGETTNTVFVGHSAYQQYSSDGQIVTNLFGQLVAYTGKTRYLKNCSFTIQVQTLQKVYNYKIISALKFTASLSSDELSVYNTVNVDTQEEFDTFFSAIKENNVMDTSALNIDCSAQFGDKFLTLLTCSTRASSDRVLIVAKQV